MDKHNITLLFTDHTFNLRHVKPAVLGVIAEWEIKNLKDFFTDNLS